MDNQGMLIILSGPSGSGKDTILSELSRRETQVRVSTSLTTRVKRDWEVDGSDYYFVSKEYFNKKLEENMVLEFAEYGGNYYGTPKAPVDDMLEKGYSVILKIEVQGAQKIREIYPDAVSIFLMPPSMQVLEERLRCRETEDEEDIIRRMSIAAGEIKRAVEYDYIVVNNEVNYAVSDICCILCAEKRKSKRAKNIISEVVNNA